LIRNICRVKIVKGIKGLLLMLKYPSALQRIYLDEDIHRSEVIKKYNLPKGLPVIDIADLLGPVDETLLRSAFSKALLHPWIWCC
jgi:hypothetical protein